MLFRNIKINIYKILTGYGFYVCVLFTTVLCFSTYIYNEPLSDDNYSAFMALLSFDKEYMLTNTCFCSFEVMQQGAGSWLSLFIPLISAFAFIPLVCDEYEAKSIRFEVFRSSKACYNLSKFITACLCGGFAVMLGFSLFTIADYIVFPSITEYAPELRSFFEEDILFNHPEFAQYGYGLLILKKQGEMFLYGMLCATPAITLTCLIRNKYLVLCIPFFIKYALNQTCIKLMSQALADLEHTDQKLLRFSSIINPDAISFLSDYGDDKLLIIIYNTVFLVVELVLYLIIQGRRLDSGE